MTEEQAKFEEVKSIQQDTKILQQIIGEAMKGNREGMTVNVLTIGVIQIGTVQHDGRSAHLLASKNDGNGKQMIEHKEGEISPEIAQIPFKKPKKFTDIGIARMVEALRKHNWVMRKAADDLGVNYGSFLQWAQKSKITHEEWPDDRPVLE